MKNKIIETISTYNMIGDNENIVVAVSGGADSLCLLHFLYSVKSELKIKSLIAAHVNHNIRGEEAKRDELFVKDFCDCRNIQFELLDADIPQISKQLKCGTEEAARRIRYDFFKSLSEKFNALVATAHNANDNAETVLYNLARGSGLKGLSGIPPKRDYIIRPLIAVTREEIEDYCKDNGIQYVTDSTNLTDEYTRNKIRHNVLPVLKQINPSLERSITNNSTMLRQDDAFLSSLAHKAIDSAKTKDGYKLEKLRKLDISVLSRAVIILLNKDFKINPEYKCVLSICEIIRNGGRVNIKSNIYADANSGVFRLYRKTADIMRQSVQVADCETAEIQGRLVRFRVIEKKEFDYLAKFNNLLFKNAVDYDIINAVTVLRTRQSGDKFSPYKRGWTKSLKKFFIDEKVVSEKRDKLLLLANDNRVLWLEGFGVSEEAQITDKTKNVFLIEPYKISDC